MMSLRRVRSNKGAPGIDKMTVNEIDSYFSEHMEEIKTSIMDMKYTTQPVRRIYIPKANSKKRLYAKVKEVLKRKEAVSRPMAETFIKLNQIITGWIKYFRIGSMKIFLGEFGQWMRHKVRVIIIKQWKKPKRIYTNLQKLNRMFR